MTWQDVLAKSADYLSAHHVPDAALAAELLMARLMKVGRGFLAPHLATIPSEPHLAAMRRALARLTAGEPIQYVLGEWDFRSLTLTCDRRALIPRPETEELVTRALAELKSRTPGEKPPFIVDVGTGTGAIILSLAKEFSGDAVFLGTDISEDALALARENAHRCGLSQRVHFVAMDGLDDLDEPECIDLLISNPPYIEHDVMATLDPRVRDFEPRIALDGGATGLDFYERYLTDALNLLKSGGLVMFEIGENQGAALRDLFAGYGFAEARIEKDFAGHDRYAIAKLP